MGTDEPTSEHAPSQQGPQSGPEYAYQDLSYAIIGACMRVHRALGPGFPESVYQAAVQVELTRLGLHVVREHCYTVEYLDVVVGKFRADFVVQDTIICEFKAMEWLIDRHSAQLLSYLKASGLELGLLINFGHTSLQYKRVVNNYGRKRP